MEIRRQFGLNIKKLRKAAGISQEDLADRSGIARSYMSDCERGARNTSIEIAAKIAVGLGLPVARLFDEIDD